MKVELSATAFRQIQTLRAYIAEQSGRKRADQYIERVLRACAGLADFPGRGRVLSGRHSRLRAIPFERRIQIVYTVASEVITIRGTYYGGQDWGSRLL